MKTTITATLEEGQQLLVVNKNRDTPSFSMVGFRNEGKRLEVDPIDYWEVLQDMGKNELFVVATIAKGVKVWKVGNELHGDTIGEVAIHTSMFNNSEQNRWDRGIARLKKKGFVKSTRKSYYMLNPNLVIPADYLLAVKVWMR